MVRRHVEQLEVRQVVLNLAAAVDLEPQVGKRGIDGAQRLSRNMEPAHRRAAAGQRYIKCIRAEVLRERAFFHPCEARFVRLGQRYLDAVGFLAVRLPFRLRARADSLQGEHHFAVLAEVARIPGAQCLLVGTSLQLFESTLFERIQVGHWHLI